MGFDISNHPVDVRLIQDYLLPYIQGQRDDIDTFVARAMHLARIAHRANRWGLGVVTLDGEVHRKQRALPQERPNPPAESRSQGFLSRLFGKKSTDAEEPEPDGRQIRGLPGFDSDLSVWGRPFFIVGDSCDEALEGYDAYLRLPSSDNSEVDAMVRSMMARLDRKRADLAPQMHTAYARILDACYPLEAHVVLDPESTDYEREAEEEDLRGLLERMRTIYSKRNTNESIVLPGGEAYPASELMGSFPLEIIDIAAKALPGWMGRGYVWPTALFEKIGVDVSQVFEEPTWLFEPLVREAPALAERFYATIPENYSLGGSVRPEKVPALVDLLQKHRSRLIRAWCEGAQTSDEDAENAIDFAKILEPAVYAARHGFGFIEASEIYSGIGGVMN